MPKETFTPEQIVGKLRQNEVLVSQGRTVPQGLQGGRHRQAFDSFKLRPVIDAVYSFADALAAYQHLYQRRIWQIRDPRQCLTSSRKRRSNSGCLREETLENVKFVMEGGEVYRNDYGK